MAIQLVTITDCIAGIDWVDRPRRPDRRQPIRIISRKAWTETPSSNENKNKNKNKNGEIKKKRNANVRASGGRDRGKETVNVCAKLQQQVSEIKAELREPAEPGAPYQSSSSGSFRCICAVGRARPDPERPHRTRHARALPGGPAHVPVGNTRASSPEFGRTRLVPVVGDHRGHTDRARADAFWVAFTRRTDCRQDL
ncbi:hypothetical protein KQX54_008255 [Cotesia glomerata]|uniref:Uncharacterized protein n=1 Tax=Cotesia glomerata TaxID=32391 RepID=A0AAV7IWV3_COTGL|nr:hypothetical protein KQX54_008255 [Cotesia glomerata]